MGNRFDLRAPSLLLTLLLSLLYSFQALADRPKGHYPFSISASRIGTAEADVGGGPQSLQRESWLFDAKANYSVNRQWSLGVNLGYADLDYDWGNRGSTLFDGNLSSWQQVQRYSAGLSVSYRPDKHWMFLLAPKLQYASADTASVSDAASYGVVTSAMYRFDNGNLLGVGVAYLNYISEVRTVPYLAVNWRINESWRLGNPFSAGFTGPAGLELSYRLSQSIDFGLGSSKRTQRFLVEDDDVTVEIDEWVSFLRMGWKLNRSLSFNAYAGYYFNGELELSEAPMDSGVRTEEIENQTALALAVEYKF